MSDFAEIGADSDAGSPYESEEITSPGWADFRADPASRAACSEHPPRLSANRTSQQADPVDPMQRFILIG
jgi:hypothetical protein